MKDRTLWTWHIGAGAVILVLLGLHMVIMHLNETLGLVGIGGAEPLEWESVVERMQSAFFTISYVVLLGAALYHGFFGLRNILLELNPRPVLRRLVNLGLALMGAALFVFGTWAALASPGAAAAVGG